MNVRTLYLLASIVALAFASSSSAASAHPGHGTTAPDTPAHYLTEPIHVGTIVALVVIVIIASVWTDRRAWRRARDPE